MTSGFSFGTGGISAGFNFSAPTSSAATTSGGFSFGLASTPSVSSTTTTIAPTAASGGAGFKFPTFSSSTPSTTASSSALSFNFNPPASATTTTSSGASLFNIPTSTTAPCIATGAGSLNFGKPLTVSTNAPSTQNILTSSTAASTGAVSSGANTFPSFGVNASSGAALSTGTTTTTFGASGAGGASNLSMRQLEEKLNKWLVELKEQEERFVRQAAHVNTWDQILQKGHDEVHSLKDTLQTVKSDQSRLEAEIDFIRSQQDELERLLEPLETATASNPSSQMHQGDRQRDNMYYLAQNLDAQLRQMTDDLGKVIVHLNTNSGPSLPNDPVAQVTKILSAHMDALKWVDHNTAVLAQKVEDVTKMTTSTAKRIT